jgi:hypothetical protein
MAREQESWLTNHPRAYTRLISQDERDLIRKRLIDQGAERVGEPGPRFERFGELHEEWSLNTDRVLMHTVPIWGQRDFTIRLDSSIGFGRKLIKEGTLKRKR